MIGSDQDTVTEPMPGTPPGTEPAPPAGDRPEPPAAAPARGTTPEGLRRRADVGDLVVRAGTAFDGRHLFQLAEDRILKIDPATGQVLASIPAPGSGAAEQPIGEA